MQASAEFSRQRAAFDERAFVRISVLCGATQVFGMERMALAVARGLTRRGHTLQLLVSGWNDGDFIGRLRASGIGCETIYLGKLSKVMKPQSLWYTLMALAHLPGARRACRRYLRSFNPDVVFVYNRDWALQVLGLLSEYNTIFHVQEAPPPTAWNSKLYTRVAASVKRFAAASGFIEQQLWKLGISTDQTALIHDGVEDTEDHGAPSVTARDATIGIVGQIGSWKGHEDLLRALALLKEKGRRFRCEIIGSGDLAFVDRLKAQGSASGLDDCLEWRGYVRDASSMYGQLDIAVVPSRFDEPFGLVAVEAALRRLPVVATRRGGLPEIIVDGETGFLVDAENPQQLADRIDDLLGDAQLLRRLGDSARSRALAHFTAERMVSKLETLCEHLVSES